VNSALLSRSKVYALRALTTEELVSLLERATSVVGVVEAEPALLEQIAIYASGDARTAYNILEIAAAASEEGRLVPQAVADAVQRKLQLYDKGGEEHFNLISALHKSVRSSDPDAALYWLARMLEGGEDRMYIARRLVRMAVEDVGLADPKAVELAIACQQTAHLLGIPEGDQALAHAAIYLAVAPKSDAAYRALSKAQETARNEPSYPVPMQLRNAPTRAMKQWGYGTGYQHAHLDPEGLSAMECLPDELAGRAFYEPTGRGTEARIKERLEQIRKWISERAGAEPDPDQDPSTR